MSKLHKTKIDDEIYYYFLKNGDKRWMYRHKYKDVLGKRKEKKKSSFKTEKEAYRSLLELKAALLSGQSNHLEKNQMTVSRWLDIWYETNYRDWKITTKTDIKSTIKKHFKPLIGRYKLNDLTHSTYRREFINKLLDDEYSPNSVTLYHKYFMMAINSAVRDEVLPKNHLRGVKIKSENGAESNFLTPEELSIFLRGAKKYGNITEYTLTLLLAYSGIRKGEAYGLKWNNIDFENNTVTIESTRDNHGKRTPKTKGSYRTIQIDPIVIKQLEKYQKWCVKTKLSSGMQLDKENDIVFISDNSKEGVGSFYINNFFYRLYNKLESNGIKLKKITPHGLRHSHATILIDALISPNVIANRLGNTLEMIYKVYAHKFNRIDNESALAFADHLRKSAR